VGEPPFTRLRIDVVSRWFIERAGETIEQIAERLEYVGEPEFEWSTMPPSGRPFFMALVDGDEATLVEATARLTGTDVWVSGADRFAGSATPPSVSIGDMLVPETLMAVATGRTIGEVLGDDAIPGLSHARVASVVLDEDGGRTILTIEPEWTTHPLRT